jgi:hypothetical protein
MADDETPEQARHLRPFKLALLNSKLWAPPSTPAGADELDAGLVHRAFDYEKKDVAGILQPSRVIPAICLTTV